MTAANSSTKPALFEPLPRQPAYHRVSSAIEQKILKRSKIGQLLKQP
jgi:hypothetical protein